MRYALKAEIKDKIERYLEIETLYDLPIDNDICYSNVTVVGEQDVYAIVNQIKIDWQVGEDGINNLIEILEDNGIKVIEIGADNSFDGLSGYINGRIPIIVLNANLQSERKRFTALHELGHLVLNFSESLGKRSTEKLCNLFASEMLISSAVLIKKLGANRSDISLKELIDIQQQFGISISQMVYMIWKLKIISRESYANFRKKKNLMPDFTVVVEKCRIKAECPTRFERLVYRALAEEIITISKAADLLGESVDRIHDENITIGSL